MINTRIIFLASGLAFAVVLYIALKDAPRVLRSLRGGRRIKGRIVRDDLVPFRYSAQHFPVIMFHDESGILYEVRTRYDRETPVREQMSEVDIAYLPEDPRTTAVLIGFRFYLRAIAESLYFLTLVSAIPALLMWAQI